MADTLPHTTPYAQEWLAFEEQSGGRSCLKGSVHDIREQFWALFNQLQTMLPPPGDDITTEEHQTAEGVRVRVYKPAGAGSDLPTGLYIHSGGWACGTIEGEDHLCRQLAASVPCVLVSPEYRLAPEHPFPAGLDDCVSAYRWMANNASSFGGNPSKLFHVGGSAGGNYSLTTPLKILDDYPEFWAKNKPRGIFALCPATCFLLAIKELPDELRHYEHPDAYGDAAMIDKACAATCEGLRIPTGL